jgi:hypothetical protein
MEEGTWKSGDGTKYSMRKRPLPEIRHPEPEQIRTPEIPDETKCPLCTKGEAVITHQSDASTYLKCKRCSYSWRVAR